MEMIFYYLRICLQIIAWQTICQDIWQTIFCIVLRLMRDILQFLATCCSAALHRRHLMVWKIFAPRFVFEGVSFIVTTVILAASFLSVLRVDQALRSWFRTLGTS